MKKYDYYRPAVVVNKRKKIRKPLSLSFLKPLFLLVILAGLVAGGYWFGRRVYQAMAASRVGTWKPTSAVVSGSSGALTKELQLLAEAKLSKPFSIQDAVQFQKELSQKYPQLYPIQVKRGLVSGKLKITVKKRIPLAKFVSEDGTEQLLDREGVVYQDPRLDPLQKVQMVELEGDMPSKLGEEWTDLIKSALKLKRQLDFSVLKLNLTENTVEMKLPDGSLLHFGQAKNLRQKVYRAAQIEALAQEKQLPAHELDFMYFDEGKVFLRQMAH